VAILPIYAFEKVFGLIGWRDKIIDKVRENLRNYKN
jgi:hypothetical protein